MTSVGIALVLTLTPVAHAITITDATLSAGTVTVKGNKAAKAAPITWEGTQVATSTNGGAFTFTTAVVPADCTGTVTDGVSAVDVAIAGCTVPPPLPAALTATGQRTCWTAGFKIDCSLTGQDGEVKAGAELSYTDNGDGTITDNNTGLIWEKKTLTYPYDIHTLDNIYSWDGAFSDFIAVLNTDPCFANYCDWRLPNVKELQSIVNYEVVGGNGAPTVSAAFNDCV
jgi:hypothetical protein